MYFCFFFEKFFWLIFVKFLHYFWIDLYINFWIVFGSILGSFSAQFLGHFWFNFETLFGSDFGLICAIFLGQIGVVFNMCYIQIILCSHEELNRIRNCCALRLQQLLIIMWKHVFLQFGDQYTSILSPRAVYKV